MEARNHWYSKGKLIYKWSLILFSMMSASASRSSEAFLESTKSGSSIEKLSHKVGAEQAIQKSEVKNRLKN